MYGVDSQGLAIGDILEISLCIVIFLYWSLIKRTVKRNLTIK